MVLDAKKGQATLLSPWFNRSDAGHGKCVKFRFMFKGHGNHSLHLFQKVIKDLTPTPVWGLDSSEEGHSLLLWQYGQVSITGTRRHQVWNAVSY